MVSMTSAAIAEDFGLRLRQARLNSNKTQVELAELTGLSKKIIAALEQGNGKLTSLISVLQALDKIEQLSLLLPEQGPSPLQLAKMQGKVRERASKSTYSSSHKSDDGQW